MRTGRRKPPRPDRGPDGDQRGWVTDITYIETAEGWLYLAALLDVWSRRMVGWACGPTLHVSLVLAALQAALRQRRPAQGLLHHSDRGVQYACQDYAAALAAAGLVGSMSRRGNCYDNAMMESFWSTLKTETGLDAAVPIQSTCRRTHHLRLYRDVLQPDEASQLARLPLTCGLRKPTN